MAEEERLLRSFGGPLQRSLEELSREVLGESVFGDSTTPREYTGELIGIEYLYSQTGRALQAVSLDPDTPDTDEEGNLLPPPSEDPQMDGAPEEVEDVTVPPPGDFPEPHREPWSWAPADEAPALEPAGPPAPEPALQSPGRSSTPPPEPAEVSVRSLSGQSLGGAAGASGPVREGGRSFDRPLRGLVAPRQGPGELPPSLQGQANSGRFKSGKPSNPCVPGLESLKRCLTGESSGPATWPSASRIMEAVCTELCLIYSASTYSHRGVRRGRWDYILMYYHHIRNLVLGSQRLMARAPIQLAEINRRTLSQWYTATLREKERLLLAPGPGAAAGGLQPAAPTAPALPPPPAAAPVLVHWVGPPAAAHAGQAAPGRPTAFATGTSTITTCVCCPGRTTSSCRSCSRTFFPGYSASPGPLTAPAEGEGAPRPPPSPCSLLDIASRTASSPRSPARARSACCRTAPIYNKGPPPVHAVWPASAERDRTFPPGTDIRVLEEERLAEREAGDEPGLSSRNCSHPPAGADGVNSLCLCSSCV
ncbi:uncharacterized protein LOC129407731 [Boleophthalmus pectinirostris]|uniref:uncharacterized protein LOC129407731 n=1 Tax=Boleophthalmus pectinirostris TaxID=150288 RepID=UPI00242D64CC|nr:uncharacterized protein LOC129407731 [Boleophthalmus pectinirostris]